MEEGVTKATYLNSIISSLSDKIDTRFISDGNIHLGNYTII